MGALTVTAVAGLSAGDNRVRFSELQERAARLRYDFREGRDLWLGYHESMNTDRPALAMPRLPLSRSRAVLMECTHQLGR